MAIPLMNYSSVNTKARALFGKLISKHEYIELQDMKTVRDVAAYLKKSTGYSDLLSGINENLVHRGELEKLFKSSLYGDFIKMLHFLKGGPGEFLKAAFLRHEVEDLKMLFRLLYTNRENEDSKQSLIFLKRYSQLDYKSLCKSSSVPEVIANLKGSQYFKTLSPFSDSSRQPTLFDLEMSLDLNFFMNMLKLKDKLLSGTDRASISHTFGVEIDLINILMIYRCKKLFKFPAELTYKYVIPHWYRLSREQLIHLTQSHDTEELKSILTGTAYSEVFKADEEHLWETNSLNYTYRMFKSHFRRDSFSIGVLIAYLHLKEMDIRNIITLIEGVRYSLPKEEIRGYLVGLDL